MFGSIVGLVCGWDGGSSSPLCSIPIEQPLPGMSDEENSFLHDVFASFRERNRAALPAQHVSDDDSDDDWLRDLLLRAPRANRVAANVRRHVDHAPPQPMDAVNLACPDRETTLLPTPTRLAGRRRCCRRTTRELPLPLGTLPQQPLDTTVKLVFPDQETLQRLQGDPDMQTGALQRGPAAAAFQGATAAVEQRLREIGVAAFKLGIAMSPMERFRGHHWSYAISEGFTEMVLLMASTATECRILERMLIATFRALPGCHNEAPGGEGMRDSESLCFAYCVFADAGTGRPLVRRRRV